MARPSDELVWSFPWTEDNSIRLRDGHEFEDLNGATKRDGLYALYLESQQNIDKYRSDRYANDFVLRAIEQRL